MKNRIMNLINQVILEVLCRGFRVLYRHDQRVRDEVDSWKMLPACMMYNCRTCSREYAELLPYLAGWEAVHKIPVEKRPRQMICEVIRLRKKLHKMTGLPLTLKEVGVDPADFPEVARTALNDGSAIVNPRQVSYEAVMKILEVSYGD